MTLDWIMGFIEGEGSFSISPSGPGTRLRCMFQLNQRDDNAEVLSEIRKIIGGNLCPKIPGKGSRPGANPAMQLSIGSKDGCAKLIDLLSRTKMHTKKRMDYVIWVEAVKAWQVQDWGKMERLADAIKTVRKYRPTVDPKYLKAA
jgi:hypothetical protein